MRCSFHKNKKFQCCNPPLGPSVRHFLSISVAKWWQSRQIV